MARHHSTRPSTIRSTQQAMPPPAWGVSADRRIVLWTSEAEQQFGYSHHQMLNQPLSEFIAPLLGNTFPQLNAQQLSMLLSQFFDMSVDSPVMIWMADAQGRYTHVSNSWLKFTGNNRATELNNPWGSRIHPDDYERAQRQYQEAFRDRIPLRAEYRLRQANGEYRWLLDHGVPLQSSPQGNLLGYIGSCLDITPQKEIEHNLRESESRFRDLADAAPVLITMTDPQGQPIYFNRYFEELTGMPVDKALRNDQWLNCIHPQDRPRLASIMEHFPIHKPFSFENRIRHKSGKYRFMFTNCHPRLFRDGSLAGYVSSSVDITDQKAASRRMQHMLESTLIGIVFAQRDGLIVDANDAFFNITGYTRADLAERKLNWIDLTPPEYRELDNQYFIQLDQSESLGEAYEKQFIKKDGQRVDVLVGGSHLAGSQTEGIGFILDISKRKQAERALAYQNNLNRLLMENSTAGLFMMDSQGRCTFMNPAAEAMSGFTLAEVQNQSLHDLVHHTHPDGSPYPAEDCPIRLALAQGKSIMHLQQDIFIRKDGQFLTAEWVALPIVEHDQLVGTLIEVHDITREVQFRQSLESSLERERLNRRILEITTQSFDLAHILTAVAQEIGPFFGVDRCILVRYEKTDAPGEPRYHATLSGQYTSHPDIRPFNINDMPADVFRLWSENLSEQDAFQLVRNNTPDMQRQWLHKYIQRLPISSEQQQQYIQSCETLLLSRHQIQANLQMGIQYRGQGYGAIFLQQCDRPRQWTDEEVRFLSDITHHVGSALWQTQIYQQEQQARQELQRYAARLERSNQELEEFTAIASHDLQAPLRKVILFSDGLKSTLGDNLPSEAKDYLERMQKSSRHMQTLINDLLALSRITRKGRPFEPVDLQDIVRDVLLDLDELLTQTQGRVEVDRMMTIEADPTQMRQLLQNLIGNALKFHKPGQPPDVRISTQRIDSQQCQMIVQDHGIGFDNKYLDRIFGVFERLHTDHEFEGTGMGLAICAKIAERHGGHLNAHGEPGVGATFTVTLPIHHPHPARASASSPVTTP